VGIRSTLTTLHGIGPSGAARLLVEAGDINRFPSKAHFASWNGTAPIDASSGDQVRHRLSRAGNRQVNRALHIMAVVQLRNPTEGRAYHDRKVAAEAVLADDLAVGPEGPRQPRTSIRCPSTVVPLMVRHRRARWACPRSRARGAMIRRSWRSWPPGTSRASAARTARSAHDSPGAVTWRRGTAT